MSILFKIYAMFDENSLNFSIILADNYLYSHKCKNYKIILQSTTFKLILAFKNNKIAA